MHLLINRNFTLDDISQRTFILLEADTCNVISITNAPIVFTDVRMGFLHQYFHDVDLGVDQVDQAGCAIVGDKTLAYFSEGNGDCASVISSRQSGYICSFGISVALDLSISSSDIDGEFLHGSLER